MRSRSDESDNADHGEGAQQILTELRSLLRELDGRIVRQRKRVERAQILAPAGVNGRCQPSISPAAAERSLLSALIEQRELLVAKIATIDAAL